MTAPPLEQRSVRLPVELRSGQPNSRTVGGYSALFDNPSRDLGGYIEVVDRRAFAKSQGDGWGHVVARWNHSDDLLLGTVASGSLT